MPQDPPGGAPRTPAAPSPRPREVPVGVLGAIATGGALGALARDAVARLVGSAPGTFPWATWWTNVLGALALGVVVVVLVDRAPPGRYARPLVAIGFLGSFTTFSTFAVETDLLVADGHLGLAVAYAGTMLGASLAAATAGAALARRLPRRTRTT